MGFFPITFGGLTMPPLWILFQNWLVTFSVQVEAAPGPGKFPSPAEALGSGNSRGVSPTFRTAASRAGSRVCPQALQVPVEESRELTASVRHGWTFPSFPPSPFCGSACLAFHAPAAPGGRRWEKRGKKRLILCSTVTLISQA